jgi:hypothetical protein
VLGGLFFASPKLFKQGFSMKKITCILLSMLTSISINLLPSLVQAQNQTQLPQQTPQTTNQSEFPSMEVTTLPSPTRSQGMAAKLAPSRPSS